MIQELTEDLQSMEQESLDEKQESEVTQESDLEQEDSEEYLTETEEQWLPTKQNSSSPCFDQQIIDETIFQMMIYHFQKETLWVFYKTNC